MPDPDFSVSDVKLFVGKFLKYMFKVNVLTACTQSAAQELVWQLVAPTSAFKKIWIS